MSGRKTISINPRLFSVSKNKTQKRTKKDSSLKSKPTIVPPNLFKNKILNRIKKHKQQELKQKEKSNKSKSFKNDDEFTSSIEYLNSIAKKHDANEKKNKRNTIKHRPSISKTNMNVNIELPEELNSQLEEVNDNKNILQDVPYGILKKGNKPTYRQYYNKTLKQKELQQPQNKFYEQLKSKKTPPITESIDNHLPFEIQNVKPTMMNPMMLDRSKVDNIPEVLESGPGPAPEPEPEPEPTHDQKFRKKSKRLNKITKKTIKRTYTLGKKKNARKVGVLIKNNKTQKNIMNAYRELKKSSIKEIKDYLHKHNLIKVGSNIPLDVSRQMYEAAKMAGDITNNNSSTILHNLENDQSV